MDMLVDASGMCYRLQARSTGSYPFPSGALPSTPECHLRGRVPDMC